MSDFKLKFEHVSTIPFAEITAKGIKYGTHEFNAKVMVKDPDTKKDIEVTVVRRAEREWMLGTGPKEFIMAQHAIIFDQDAATLKSRAEALQKFLFRV
jgi:hypothetical protein